MKTRVSLMAIAALLAVSVVGLHPNHTVAASGAVATPSVQPQTCVPAVDGSAARGPCQISYCNGEGERCVNTGGHCPGHCYYECGPDDSCIAADPLPPCA